MSNVNSTGPGQGAVNIVQRIATIIVGIAETRIRLLAVELEEEKSNLFQLILMSGLALISLVFGLMSLLILICWSIDPSYRFTILAVFSGVLLFIALLFAIIIFSKIKRSTFLQETRRNLKTDRELLEGKQSD
jgi:uncharacterized membrane protein YqjE